MPRTSRPYEVGLYERLRDRSHAVSYLNAAAEDSIEGFLLALRDCVEATKGMTKVAADADKNRENLYRMLSEAGNPRLDSLSAVLQALGFRINVSLISEETPPLIGGGRDFEEPGRALSTLGQRMGPPGIGNPTRGLGELNALSSNRAMSLLMQEIGAVPGSVSRGISQPAECGTLYMLLPDNPIGQSLHR